MSRTGASNDSSFGSYREGLRQVAKRELERPVESDEGLKLAQVLYVFAEDEYVNPLQDYSVRIPKEEKSKLTKIIARIPVIHSAVDEPTDKDIEASKEKSGDFDYRKTPIGNYPVFVAQNEDIGLPSVGNYVWVQYNKASQARFGVYTSLAEGSYAGKDTTSENGPADSATYSKNIAANPVKKTWLKDDVVKNGALIDKKNEKQPWVHFVEDGVNVYDCRGFFNPPRLGLFLRPMQSITGIMLHRTSCLIGNKVQQHAETNAHVAVTMDGNIYLIHPWTLGIFHGHGLSEASIGIEFDGNPEGFPGYLWVNQKYKKNGKVMDKYKEQVGPHVITPAQVKASKVLLKIILREVEKGGGKITNILAHRQSTEDRESDPGWECWQKIAMPWQQTIQAAPTIGLKINTGKPIPKAWDLSSPYNWSGTI